MAANGQGGSSVPDGGKQIFLSYARKDDVNGFVSKLKQDLDQRGFSVWMDRGDIPAGSGWVSRIGSAIQGCSGLIAVVTNNYVKSENCTKELNMAHTSSKKIFPIIRGKVDYTQSEKGPGVKFVIQDINWVSFNPDEANYNYSQSFTQLVDGLIARGIQPDAKEATDFVPDDGSEAAGIDPICLTINDKQAVKKELGDFSDWNDLGLNLGLSPTLLDVIEGDQLKVKGRVDAVVSNWLKRQGIDKTKKPTWHQLVTAVEPINYALAQEIKKNHPN